MNWKNGAKQIYALKKGQHTVILMLGVLVFLALCFYSLFIYCFVSVM